MLPLDLLMFTPISLKLTFKPKLWSLQKYLRLGFVGLLCMSLVFAGCRGSRKSKSGRKKSAKTSYNTGGVNIGNKQISTIISTARSYTGTPHRDGGVNRLGIDCSALMVMSFESVGFKLPRTSKEQANLGKPVNMNEIKPGDLVFFADRNIGIGITHVGLVTEVKGPDNIKFIHTSSRLGVVENLLSHSYFKKTFVKAMRPYS